MRPDPRFCKPPGSFWATLPKRERLPGELEALRELAALVAAEEAAEKRALAEWLEDS